MSYLKWKDFLSCCNCWIDGEFLSWKHNENFLVVIGVLSLLYDVCYVIDAEYMFSMYSGMKNRESIEEGNLRSAKEGFLSSKIHVLLNCIRSRYTKILYSD